MGVGGGRMGLLERELVRGGDVDSHGVGMGARSADGGTVVVEAELLEGRGDGSRMPRRVKYFSV